MDVLMPQLGETVAEGKITKWFKSAGDAVKPGDNLFEIETDKVSMEVPSTTAGVLAEIRVGVGEVAPVGAVVAVIAGEGGCGGEAAGAPLPRRGESGEAVRMHPVPACSRRTSGSACPRRHAAGPRAARSVLRGAHARAQLRPGAAAGRRDRDAAGAAACDRRQASISAASRRPARTAASSRATWRLPPRRSRAGPAVRGPSAAEIMALYRDVPFKEVPLDGMRKTIATRLVQAKQTIPHFYLTADLDDRPAADAARGGQRRRAPPNVARKGRRDGGAPAFRLSVNDLVIKAWAAALQRVPAANAVWAEDRILRFTQSDIGVAVAIEGGLIVPVIRRAETKSLTAISAEMRELAARARDRKLKPNEYQGGASAISNLGMYGVREFSAIINPPHATILAVGAARRQAVEKDDGSVGFASVMTVTLSCDHRVVDGALGAELLAAFRGFVEQPVTALV